MTDAAVADRLQFAFTIMFHYLFPVLTMGLAPFLVILKHFTSHAATNCTGWRPGSGRGFLR